MNENMAVFKKVTITLHPIEIEKLDKIAKQNQETKSGMIARLIKDYQDKRTDKEEIADLTELSHELRDRNKKN